MSLWPEKARSLRAAASAARGRVRRFATEHEIAQVRIAAWASVAVGTLSALFLSGVWSKLLVAGPLVCIGAGLVAALVHTAAFRERRLRSGHCANPLCHGVVQHSPRVPDGYVICPTCQHVWPEAEAMVFLLTQREPGVGTSGLGSPQ